MMPAHTEVYIAFLRGINVGRNKLVAMADLRKLCESMGFKEVKTLLNSGNLVFTHQAAGQRDLENKIGAAFQKRFGFESKIILRTKGDIEGLVSLNPFRNIKASKDLVCYVTFLRDKSAGTLKLPYASPNKEIQILKSTGREVFSVISRTGTQSPKFMAFLEQTYGKDVTTRNWNTVLKIEAL